MMTKRTARIILVVIVVAALFGAWRGGVFAHVSDPPSLARDVVDMGAWGYLAFVLAYAFVQPFGVPGMVFVVAASLIWPWPTAFALSMIGTMAATMIGFSFARFVARDWVSARIPARLRKYDQALEHRGFRTVVFLRVIFAMSQILHSVLGVSKVRFTTHFWGSLLAYVPIVFLVSYLGSELFDAAGHVQARVWPIIGAMVAASAVLLMVFRMSGNLARDEAPLHGRPRPGSFVLRCLWRR